MSGDLSCGVCGAAWFTDPHELVDHYHRRHRDVIVAERRALDEETIGERLAAAIPLDAYRDRRAS
jgi:hypothetical protein